MKGRDEKPLSDGRVLVGVFNYDRKSTKDVEVKLDLAKLGLAGKPLVMRDLYKDYSDKEVQNDNCNSQR